MRSMKRRIRSWWYGRMVARWYDLWRWYYPSWMKHSLQAARAYWGASPADSEPALEMLAFHVRRVREHIEGHQLYVGWERDVRHMKIVEHLVWRINNDEVYFEIADATFGDIDCQARWRRPISTLPDQDMEMLMKYLKYLRRWWC